MALTDDHWWAEAERCPSPNQDERPAEDAEPELLVIHGISLPEGEFGTGHIRELFLNRLDCARHASFADLAGLRVSSHLLIERDGHAVQFVPFDRRAWHAGRSSFRGRRGCNDFSIGIELEGSDTLPYGDAQYATLIAASRALFCKYRRLSLGAVVGHAEIAPGRKSDPGPAFDWRRYVTALTDAGMDLRGW